MLEAENIFAAVPDEHMLGMNWLYLNVLGGVRLQVRSDDVARADEILRSETIDSPDQP
jgi:hypothetical protein